MSHQLLQRFNDSIDQWIAFLDHYSWQQLLQSPAPGAWSLGQLYMHLIEDTTYHVEQMKAALLATGDSDKEMHPDAKTIFAQEGFPDVLIAGPATYDSVMQPVNKAALLQGLEQVKYEVQQLLSARDIMQARGKTMHPGLHFFSAAEWLQFTTMHMQHHLRQKARIDRLINKNNQEWDRK
ncbi:DinB family protein [Chitinophaga eiseniae]|uniref:DinB family protein n=1 Tax=Chitinophaga eiseniae TaxID=634771 RepID=A0A847SRN1_9BACT|nr:DinB family protein [Chitinophaga eiseniae]NLR80638.1 DinB family protein [Chitinophaga eiseniae]